MRIDERIEYIPDHQSGQYEGKTDVFYQSADKQFLWLGYILEDAQEESDRYRVFDGEDRQVLACSEWHTVDNHFQIMARLIESNMGISLLELIRLRRNKHKRQSHER